MRVLFMGTPEIAAESLRRLAADGFTVCGACSQPDRPKGRGYALVPTPVKLAAQELGIPVFQPDGKLREPTTLQCLNDFAPDVIAVVAYGRLLPPAVLELPRLGCINLHGSLLPAYRGAAPIEWAVINGETVTGMTTMYMAAGMDTGDTIYAESTPIGPDETGAELRARLSTLGAALLSRTLKDVEAGIAPRTPQDDSRATPAPLLTTELGRYDPTLPAQKLHDLIRGLSPAPGVFAFADGCRLRLIQSRRCDDAPAAPGSLRAVKGRLVLSCPDGCVELVTVQPEGKKPMAGAAFFNGHPVAALTRQ